jgi:hypothetical protein
MNKDFFYLLLLLVTLGVDPASGACVAAVTLLYKSENAASPPDDLITVIKTNYTNDGVPMVTFQVKNTFAAGINQDMYVQFHKQVIRAAYNDQCYSENDILANAGMNDSPFEAVCSTRPAVPFARVNLWVTGGGGPDNLPKCCHNDELAAVQYVFHLLCECPFDFTPAPTEIPSGSPSLAPTECCPCPSEAPSDTPSGAPTPGCIASESQSVCQNFALHARTSIAFTGDTSVIQSGDVGIYPGLLMSGLYLVKDGDIVTSASNIFATTVTGAQLVAMATRDNTQLVGEIGGTTLTPGTYRSATAISIAAGKVLTLDGNHQADASFLFQAGTAITTGAGSSFVLINGATAANVLWATSLSAALGANSVFEGSILAGTSIAFGAGSEIHGCALCQTTMTAAAGVRVIYESEGDIDGDCEIPTTSESVCQNFAVHARTSVIFTGDTTTIEDGDIGIYPGVIIKGAYKTANGGIVSGSNIFAAQVTAARLVALVARPQWTLVGAIGGMTLTPGTYRSATAISIAAGNVVTLDGQNKEDPTFLFQALTAVTVGADVSFILINGAKAENIVWATGTSATIGANSVFEGSILGGTTISFGSNSVAHGCALSQSTVSFASDVSLTGWESGNVTVEVDCDTHSDNSTTPTFVSLANDVCQNFAVHARTSIVFSGDASTIPFGDIAVYPGLALSGAYSLGDGSILGGTNVFATSVTGARLVALVSRPDTTLVADIGGMTLTPGTYYSATTITIAAGNVVTLDGENAVDPVFLFQAGTSVMTGADTSFIMINGAKKENVFWATTTSVLVGENSILEGTILAGTFITFGKNSVLHGCALSQTTVNLLGGVSVIWESEGSNNITCYTPPEPTYESISESVCQNYAVHAKTSVLFAGDTTTIYDGDISIYPGVILSGAYKTVNGGVVPGDSVFAVSKTAARLVALEVRDDGSALAIELGGTTITPGVYRSATAFTIAAGTVVTLDGQNEANPVFHFQAPTTLVTGVDTSFILINGAKAENILWAVGVSVALGADSILEGSVLAGTAVTFGANSELHGCALSDTTVSFLGGVSLTLDSDGASNETDTSDSTDCDNATAPIFESVSHSLCQNYAVHARTSINFIGDSSSIHYGDMGIYPGVLLTGAYKVDDGSISIGASIADGANLFAMSVTGARLVAMQARPGIQLVAAIGGMTLTPGTYYSATGISIAAGTVVTLDGQNETYPVFRFQAGTTVMTGADTSFILINGAKAENVLWATGTGAFLGANSVLVGSILAGTVVNLGAGSELHGCALAQTIVNFASGAAIIFESEGSNSFNCDIEAESSYESISDSVCQNFAVHARTTIAFIGTDNTIYDGDMGLNPGTGLPTGSYKMVNGKLLSGTNVFATSVKASFLVAKEARPDRKTVGAIGGSTLTPGTHISATSITIAANTVVTLDGENATNPVFLFQAGTALITGVGSSFLLINGAKAENILWAPGTGAILGANSVFEGSILAGTSVALAEGAEMHGCALAATSVSLGGGASVTSVSQSQSAECPAALDSDSVSYSLCQNFAVHAGNGDVTFSGVVSTIQSGDVGVFPGSSIIGTPTLRDGTTVIGDSVFAASVSAALLAALVNQSDSQTIPVEIGGMIFGPGTYRSDTGITLAASTEITFDGQNDPNSVFLLQAAGGPLAIGAGTDFILTNCAKKENIYWAISDSASIGEGGVVVGSILAGTYITFGDGARLYGCALAQTAVSLLSDGTVVGI